MKKLLVALMAVFAVVGIEAFVDKTVLVEASKEVPAVENENIQDLSAHVIEVDLLVDGSPHTSYISVEKMFTQTGKVKTSFGDYNILTGSVNYRFIYYRDLDNQEIIDLFTSSEVVSYNVYLILW